MGIAEDAHAAEGTTPNTEKARTRTSTRVVTEDATRTRTVLQLHSLLQDDLPAVGPAYCHLEVVISPWPMDRSTRREDFPGYLKRRTDERQNTQKENTQQRSDSAHTYTQPTQLKLLEHRLQSTTPRHTPNRGAGFPCRALLYVPRGVNLDFLLDLNTRSRQRRPVDTSVKT